MRNTPSNESDTTRKPDTAPPRSATVRASPRERRAAEAVRRLERTATYIPMNPETAEHAAPSKKAIEVIIPSSSWVLLVPAALCGIMDSSTPTSTAVTTASKAMVVYWRLRKAIAPSKIVSAIACISGVPVSRLNTSRARYAAKRIAITPATGTNHTNSVTISMNTPPTISYFVWCAAPLPHSFYHLFRRTWPPCTGVPGTRNATGHHDLAFYHICAGSAKGIGLYSILFHFKIRREAPDFEVK